MNSFIQPKKPSNVLLKSSGLILSIGALMVPYASLADEASHAIKGRINLGWQTENYSNDQTTDSDLKSNASRIAVLGNIPVSDNLKFFYHIEAQIDAANELSSDTVKARNQYIGLKGDFGEIIVGRNDTVLKKSQGKIDLFNDYSVDIKKLWKGDNRIDRTITYKTKAINNIQYGAMYHSARHNRYDDGVSLFARYGDAKLKKSDYSFAIAADRDIKGYDIERINGSTKVGGVKLNLGYQIQHEIATGKDSDGIVASAAYPFSLGDKKADVRFQYQDLEENQATSVGFDYYYDGKNKFYVWLADFDKAVNKDKVMFSVGIQYHFGHKF